MERRALTADDDRNDVEADSRLEPRTLSRTAREIYGKEVGSLTRVLQTYRPYVCPFGHVLRQVPAGAEVLDVGCGAGLLLLLMARLQLVTSGFGFDISPAAISAAKSAAQRMEVGEFIRFETRQAEEGLPEGNWNVITAVDVLHHVPIANQRRFFMSMCDALPPNGRLIIKDMVARPYWRSLANQLHDLLLARQVVHHVNPDVVAGWARDRGLRLVELNRVDTLWYGHWIMTLAWDGGPA